MLDFQRSLSRLKAMIKFMERDEHKVMSQRRDIVKLGMYTSQFELKS